MTTGDEDVDGLIVDEWIRDGGAITVDTLTINATASRVRLTCTVCGDSTAWDILDVLRAGDVRAHIVNLCGFFAAHQHDEPALRPPLDEVGQ